ncbi:DUF4469 domain-containing protein, partial [Candidatus Uhrbacteria bacterium]|nr:DUF4469 domain-containing protein [Candidatus Uhrbacteria bacterium]
RNTIGEHAQPVKQESVRPRPKPLAYIDLNTGARDGMLTPGGLGQVTGYRLKFDPADVGQGIFFVAEDGTETQVVVVGRNKPTELLFLVPERLTAGPYTLEVRAILPNRGDLRVGALDEPLTIA